MQELRELPVGQLVLDGHLLSALVFPVQGDRRSAEQVAVEKAGPGSAQERVRLIFVAEHHHPHPSGAHHLGVPGHLLQGETHPLELHHD